MQPVRRIVIRDGPPIFNPGLVRAPADLIALAVAILSLCVQVSALAQVIHGAGDPVGVADHASFAAVALLWFLLGVTVYLQRAGTPAGRLFLLSSAAGSSYLGEGTLSGVSAVNALLYSTGLVTFAPLMLGFVRALRARRTWSPLEFVLYLPPLALIWPLASDFLGGRHSFGYRSGILSVGVYLLACVIQALRNLSRVETPEEARQTRALVLGLIGGTVPGIMVFVVPLALFGRLLVVTTWQPLIGLLFITAMCYAALLFEFSVVDLIVRRGVVYGLVTGVLVAAYGVVGIVLVADRRAMGASHGDIGFAVLMVLVGAGFGPARRLVHVLVDRTIYGGATDGWQVLQRLSDRMSTVMQPIELGDILVRDLSEALKLRGAMLLRRAENGDYVLSNRAGQGRAPFRGEDMERSFRVSGRLVRAALEDPAAPLLLVHTHPLRPTGQSSVPEEYAAFDAVGAALIFPLQTRSGFEGVLCLQSKQTHDEFSDTDLALLVPVIRQASAALDNALLLSRLEETVEELRTAYHRLSTEQEVERARLARELHDGTAQELAAMITLATVLERQLENASPAALSTLQQIRNQAENSYEGVRHASHALRPAMLDGLGLVPTLTSYLTGLKSTASLDVELSVGEVGELSPEIEWALFRVAQECLENVRKHSGSLTAQVSLGQRDDHVLLSVHDHGKGMDGRVAHGIGMSNMRERLAAVGGELQVESTEHGVCVTAQVPLAGGASRAGGVHRDARETVRPEAGGSAGRRIDGTSTPSLSVG